MSASRMPRRALGSLIREIKSEHKIGLAELTVLSAQNDPYRLDTRSGHRDAQWFAEHFEHALMGRAGLHLRGVHYALVARGDVVKPNGQPYRNTDSDWTWLQISPAKAARWLGYVPFDKIRDNRNDPPVIHRQDAVEPRADLYPGSLTVYLPEADDLTPQVRLSDFKGRQPYHLVIFGEKSSLAEVLLPIAKNHDADLYLPTGEITDTLLYQMARDGARDGRPMRVFTLADCDPAGHQMPVSIGRKLQALRDLEFADLEFEVHQIGLTIAQVRELGLPSTPLKETERRADRWREIFGTEQTEIDALSTLRPDVLRQIVEDAIAPFHDNSLSHRVWLAQHDWQTEAQRRLDERIDPGMLADLRDFAKERLIDIEAQVQALEAELYIPVPDDLDLPPIEVPDPVIDQNPQGKPLVSTDWPWLEVTAALKAHKAYDGGTE